MARADVKSSEPDKSNQRAKESGIEWDDEMAAMNAASDDKNVVGNLE